MTQVIAQVGGPPPHSAFSFALFTPVSVGYAGFPGPDMSHLATVVTVSCSDELPSRGQDTCLIGFDLTFLHLMKTPSYL